MQTAGAWVRRPLAALAGLLLLTGAGSALAQSNYITNPGFENGNNYPWTYYGGTGGIVANPKADANDSSPNVWSNFGNPTYVNVASQNYMTNLYVTPGSTYHVHAQYYIPSSEVVAGTTPRAGIYINLLSGSNIRVLDPRFPDDNVSPVPSATIPVLDEWYTFDFDWCAPVVDSNTNTLTGPQQLNYMGFRWYGGDGTNLATAAHPNPGGYVDNLQFSFGSSEFTNGVNATSGLNGVVKDGSGNPVSGATVTLSSASSMNIETALTLANGSYEFVYLAPYGTNFSVTASYGPYSSGTASLTPSSVANTFPQLTITGLASALVSGTVTTSVGGSPIAGAVVTASYATNLPSSVSTPSASNGSYSLSVIVGQAATLSVASSGYTVVSSPAPVTAPNTSPISGENFTMSLNTYTITASAGTGGSITPNGVTTLNTGGSQTYVIAPSAGYSIYNVSVDGIGQGAISSYTFTNVVASHTISALFGSSAASQSSGTISVNYYASGGNSSPLTPANNVGASAAVNWNNVTNTGPGGVTDPVQLFYDNAGLPIGPFNVVLSNGAINSWNINSVSYPDEQMLSTWVDMNSGGTATFENIPYTNSYNLYVYFSSYNLPTCTYTIGSTVETMYATNSPGTFPTTGYVLSNNYVEFTNLVGSSQVMTISRISGDSGISGFQIVANSSAYVINASAGTNGTITPSGVSVVPIGSNISYTITANSGYQIQDVVVDGVSQGPISSYTFSNVATVHTISAQFISDSVDPSLVVVLDASTLTPGVLNSWPNGGVLGGVFNSYTPTEAPTVTNVAGRQAVQFYQPSSTDAGRETLVCTKAAPTTLSGNNPWTISADLYSTNLSYINSRDAYFCWAGSSQGVGTCAEFDYLNNQAYYHQDSSGNPPGINGGYANVPSANAWHNVTLTYDGTTQTIYIDGAYDSSATMALNLAANNKLMVGGSYYQNSDRTQDQYWRLFSASISKIQVYSKCLTADVVSNMFTPLPPVTYAISGTVTVGGSPTAGVNVTLTGLGSYSVTTDGSGNYSVPVMVAATNTPAVYTVTASGVGYSTTNQTVTVNGGPVTGVNFSLVQQDVLIGTVKTTGGTPIYNAIVQVGGSNGVFAVSALDGSYRIGNVPTSSSVELYAKGLGYAFSLQNINLTGAATGVVTNNIVLTAQTATGVIYNGGFEIIDPVNVNPVTGARMPEGWHDWAGYNCNDVGGNYVPGLGDDYISSTSVPGDVYSGANAAAYNPTYYSSPSGNYSFLWQDVPVMSNSTYNVYWKMKADANVAGHVFCLISFRNTTNVNLVEYDMFSYSGGVTTNWTQYPLAPPTGQDTVFTAGQATRFAVPPGADVVNVLLGVDDSYVGPQLYFDDVVVDRNDLGAQPVTYTITATNGAGGTISPSGAVVVASGTNQTFTITPSGSAYSIGQVLVDGVNNRGAVNTGSYTFTDVIANHTIGASFVYNPPTAPSFLPVSIQSGNLLLRTATQLGYNYYLLQTTNLNPPVVWITNSITAGTGGTITNLPAINPGQSRTFYRLMAQ